MGHSFIFYMYVVVFICICFGAVNMLFTYMQWIFSVATRNAGSAGAQSNQSCGGQAHPPRPLPPPCARWVHRIPCSYVVAFYSPFTAVNRLHFSGRESQMHR